MNAQLIKTTADIVVETFIHMSNEVGLSVEDTIKAIAQGGNARKRFDAYLAIAKQQIVEMAA